MNLERREPRFETVFAFVDATPTSGSEPPAGAGGLREESTKQRDLSSGAQTNTKRRSTDLGLYSTEPVNLAVPRDIASRRGAKNPRAPATRVRSEAPARGYALAEDLEETSHTQVAASTSSRRVAPRSGSGAVTSTLVALCPGRETARVSNAPDVVAIPDPSGGPSWRGGDGAALAVFMDMNFYDALGAQPGATNAELRRAFRAVALKHHPDKGGDPQIYHYLSKVRDILLNKAKREQYDFHGRTPFAEAFSKAPPGGGAGDVDDNALPGQRVLFAPISEMLEKMAADEAWATQRWGQSDGGG